MLKQAKEQLRTQRVKFADLGMIGKATVRNTATTLGCTWLRHLSRISGCQVSLTVQPQKGVTCMEGQKGQPFLMPYF